MIVNYDLYSVTGGYQENNMGLKSPNQILNLKILRNYLYYNNFITSTFYM